MMLSMLSGARPIRARTETVYVPAGRFDNVYDPLSADFAVPTPPPPERDALIVAPANGSPDVRSVTRPLIPPF
jgi:hypothetical protein